MWEVVARVRIYIYIYTFIYNIEHEMYGCGMVRDELFTSALYLVLAYRRFGIYVLKVLLNIPTKIISEDNDKKISVHRNNNNNNF